MRINSRAKMRFVGVKVRYPMINNMGQKAYFTRKSFDKTKWLISYLYLQVAAENRTDR